MTENENKGVDLSALEIEELDKLVVARTENSINYVFPYAFMKETNIPKKKTKSEIRFFQRILKNSLLTNFFILNFIFSIILTLIFLIYYAIRKPNFKIVDLNWISVEKNDRKYENYLFDNGLEVLLIQDQLFDRDGGSIVFNKGYMDDPTEEGIATIAIYLLDLIAIKDDEEKLKNLEDYYGKYSFGIEKDFIYYNFEILNNGFKKFLYIFSLILNPQNISYYYDNYIYDIIDSMNDHYFDRVNDLYFKEDHLLQYLVFGLLNKEGKDIAPEGCISTIAEYGYDELKSKIMDFIQKLFDPKNIKIAIFSKYKFLISSKYMKKFFNYLTTMPKKKNVEKVIKENKLLENKKLKTSQIFYIIGDYYNENFIDIIYYIDKVSNESFSELYYKANYLNYIIDFLKERKKGSLYYLLTNSTNHNIKSIDSYYDIVLKSKIEFYIYIELNYLQNINDIISITYQYMDKLIKEATGTKLQMDRYMELKYKYFQALRYSDKTFETMELAKNNAKYLFLSQYDNKKNFFYQYFMPWEEKDTVESIQNKSYQYFKQLKPENSVIVFGIRIQDAYKFTCNSKSSFYLNCSYFKDYDKNLKYTNYYKVYYMNNTFNSSNFRNDFLVNNSADISFINNSYLSSHNESFIDIKNEETKINLLENSNIYYKFYFKRNTNFKLPKVYISLHLFHPYLRPMNKNEYIAKFFYFRIIEMFSAIKRKINEDLQDAIRAGNEIIFNQNENYLFINIFCYDDVAFKIMEKIKIIIYDTNWELTDFKSKNEIYKNEAFFDFFNYNRLYLGEITRNYFYKQIKNNFYNKYEFFPEDFEDNYYNICIKNKFIKREFHKLTSFIINGYIYGYYTKEQAQNISNLFESNNNFGNFTALLEDVENNKTEPTPESFINWIIDIKELNKNKNVTIHSKVYNLEDCLNAGISYVKFNESELNVTLFENILEKVNKTGNLIDLSLFKYRDIFFELLFFNKSKDEDILKPEVIRTEWNSTLYKMYEYNNPVDNIGNRYYYVKKNFNLTLFKRQKSFKQRASDELQKFLYNWTILEPETIMRMYNQVYKNKKFDKNELNNSIKHFINILERNRIDVHAGNNYNK